MAYATINEYEKLTKFTSIRDFNNNFEQSMIEAKELFTKSEYIALNKLRKFAAGVVGVAWCKLQTAVSTTHESEAMGISRSTFDRMLRKAKRINLITVIPQQRANHYRKHNVYVFNRADDLIIDGIVSSLRTIEVAENVNIDAALTNNLLELSKQKQVKDNYTDATIKMIQDSEENKPMNREQLKVYASNPFQMALYDVLSEMPYDSSIQRVKHVLALRIGSNCDVRRFTIAKQIIHSIAMQINEGYEFNNIVATFSAALNNALEYKKVIVEDSERLPVEFYNWLKERE